MRKHDRTGELDDSLRWSLINLVLIGKIILADVFDHLLGKWVVGYKTQTPIQNDIMWVLEKWKNTWRYLQMNDVILIRYERFTFWLDKIFDWLSESFVYVKVKTTFLKEYAVSKNIGLHWAK